MNIMRNKVNVAGDKENADAPGNTYLIQQK